MRIYKCLFLIYSLIAIQEAVLQAEKITDERREGNPSTVITSESLELVGSEFENIFYFHGNVEITGNNIHATCDKMSVISNRGGQKDVTIGEVGKITKIQAEGNVYIKQNGRTARAGFAEIYPQEGKVVLTDNPVVADSQGEVRGYRMVLLKSERRAIVEGALEGERPKVILPEMPDFGYEKKGTIKTPQGEIELK